MLRVIITGASSGIGAALAREYASRGATLGLIARRADRLQQLKTELAVPTEIYAVDVRNATHVRDAAAHFIGAHGLPDIVIANAGVSTGTLTEHIEDLDAFAGVLAINVVGMAATFQPFIAPMRAAGRGALVGIASVAGYRGLPGAGAYSASKAAAISYLESLRVELHGSGVRVITICPGYVATPMTDGNPYPMPFMLTAKDAALRIAHVIHRGKTYAVIPWQMALVARLLRVLPNAIFDRVLARAPHKPREKARL
jgi:short-subunit dehydrogenase